MTVLLQKLSEDSGKGCYWRPRVYNLLVRLYGLVCFSFMDLAGFPAN